MCAKEEQRAVPAEQDDVWGDDDAPERAQLDREWEARHQQFYNTGYREGIEEGKELTLQHGFNAGFAEGAQAGFEFGLVKAALQTLAALYIDPEQHKAEKIQELLQQVSALPTKTVMQDTCTALMSQPLATGLAAQLQTALQQLQLTDDNIQLPNTAALPAGEDVGPLSSSAATAAAAAGSSSSSQVGLTLPQQLVAHIRQDLLQLGFDVGSAPALPPAAPTGPTAAEEAAAPAGEAAEAAAAPAAEALEEGKTADTK